MGHSIWNEVAHGVIEMVDAANIDDDDGVTGTLQENGHTETYVLVTILFSFVYNFCCLRTILLWCTKYAINFQLERWLLQCTIYFTCTVRYLLMWPSFLLNSNSNLLTMGDMLSSSLPQPVLHAQHGTQYRDTTLKTILSSPGKW